MRSISCFIAYIVLYMSTYLLPSCSFFDDFDFFFFALLCVSIASSVGYFAMSSSYKKSSFTESVSRFIRSSPLFASPLFIRNSSSGGSSGASAVGKIFFNFSRLSLSLKIYKPGGPGGPAGPIGPVSPFVPAINFVFVLKTVIVEHNMDN